MSFFKIFNKTRKANEAKIFETDSLRKWEADGKPVPPPHFVKQSVITELKNKFKHELFIETGTYLGDMVEAQKANFNAIYSIELGAELYKAALERFKNDKNITILNGDSGDVLKELMPQINEPAIFWLDGHYSEGVTAKGKKDCPIFEELTAILNAAPYEHILLIDDARLFVGKDDYPKTSELITFVKSLRPLIETYIKNDIIYIFIK